MDNIHHCEALKDVKIAASVLKSFFRQLPDPLFTDSRFYAFVDAVPDDTSQNIDEGKNLILPVRFQIYGLLNKSNFKFFRIATTHPQLAYHSTSISLQHGQVLYHSSEESGGQPEVH